MERSDDADQERDRNREQDRNVYSSGKVETVSLSLTVSSFLRYTVPLFPRTSLSHTIPSSSTSLRIKARISIRTKQLPQLLQSACVLLSCLPRRDNTSIHPHDILLGDSG
jgi:hypothetical protein